MAETPGSEFIEVIGPSGVRSFQSAEEMFAFMHEREQEALTHTTEEQMAITYGDYFVRPYEDFAIFGRIPTWEEFEKAESGGDPEEWRWIRDNRLNADRRGYRFAWCFSVVEPNGEPGDTHVVYMTKITEQAFQEAKARDWDFARCYHDGLPWAVELISRELAE